MKTLAFILVAVALVGCSTTKTQRVEIDTTEPNKVALAKVQAPAQQTDDDVVGRTVNFEYNSHVLTDDAVAMLDRLAKKLRGDQQVAITIEGHTDDVGGDAFNLSLGEARARSVRNYLVKQGVKPARISLISYGKERPVVDGHDDYARAQNRRGELVLK